MLTIWAHRRKLPTDIFKRRLVHRPISVAPILGMSPCKNYELPRIFFRSAARVEKLNKDRRPVLRLFRNVSFRNPEVLILWFPERTRNDSAVIRKKNDCPRQKPDCLVLGTGLVGP